MKVAKILVESCQECPHCVRLSGGIGYACAKTNQRLSPYIEIADDCPLPDVEDAE